MSNEHLYPFYLTWHVSHELRVVNNYAQYGSNGYVLRIPLWFAWSISYSKLNHVTGDMPQPKDRVWEWQEIPF